MDILINNKTIVHVNPIWTGTSVGYRMAYLSVDQKRSLGLPARHAEYAVRIDGQRAELVKCVNGYTSTRGTAEILAD